MTSLHYIPGRILIFYLFYYAFLAALFAISITIVLNSLDPYKPFFQTRLQTPGKRVLTIAVVGRIVFCVYPVPSPLYFCVEKSCDDVRFDDIMARVAESEVKYPTRAFQNFRLRLLNIT